MALRTPLYDWHVAHGGRMVEFGGWDMPVQYGTIVEEHNAVRGGAGAFDISHMGRLSFAGPDALALIQKVYTNNAATLKDGQVRYGFVCNEQGGIRDDVLVYRWPYGYSMVVNASNRDKIVSFLEEHKGLLNVQVSDRTLDTVMIAVQGPKALELCRGLTAANADELAYYYATPTTYQGAPCILSRTGYTGEDGVELMIGKEHGPALWEEVVRRGARPCGLGARDTLRLEAAMPLYGHELAEDIDPYQAGLAWAVKLDKGDFVGREALRRRAEGGPAALAQYVYGAEEAWSPETHAACRRKYWQRVGLELEGRRIAREGAAVLADGREVGRVTSGTFAPTLNRSIAMAYLDPAYDAPGTPCQVDVRGKTESARVVPLPFYKRPKT